MDGQTNRQDKTKKQSALGVVFIGGFSNDVIVRLAAAVTANLYMYKTLCSKF